MLIHSPGVDDITPLSDATLSAKLIRKHRTRKRNLS